QECRVARSTGRWCGPERGHELGKVSRIVVAALVGVLAFAGGIAATHWWADRDGSALATSPSPSPTPAPSPSPSPLPSPTPSPSPSPAATAAPTFSMKQYV